MDVNYLLKVVDIELNLIMEKLMNNCEFFGFFFLNIFNFIRNDLSY